MTRRILLCSYLLACAAAEPLRGQITAADSAALLLDAADDLLADGRETAFEDLLQLIMTRYPDTPAAAKATQLLLEMRGTRHVQSGRTGLIVWSTIYGAWLGIAVPAAFGAEESEPFGVGLLLGGPLGFFGSKAYARSTSMSSGQAGLIIFGSWWGTWQGVGWRAVLDIGEQGFGTSDEAPFTAAVIGGLAGLGAGAAIARAADVSSVTASMVTHSALWGAWYGIAAAVLTEAEEDGALAWVLLAGDVGLAVGALAAPHVRWSPGQIRVISVAGLAGLVAGLGIDLIGGIDDRGAIVPPTLGATIGLLAAAATTRPLVPTRRESGNQPTSGALIDVSGGVRWNMPLPMPTVLPALTRDGMVRYRPAVRIELFRGRF